MESLAEAVIKKRKIILLVFILVSIISVFLIPQVEVNYDLSEYLPGGMKSSIALEVMEKEFSLSGMARVMVENVSLPEAVAVKERIEAVEGVKSVVWLDDVADIRKPLEFLDPGVVDDYYRDGAALYRVEFTEDNYSLNTGKALTEIQAVIGSRGVMGGTAVSTKYVREGTFREVLSAVTLAMPLIVLILIMTTQSWFEPLIYLFVLGVSVLINMGTNLIFGRISFITQSCAAILQLAISMDYSLFLLHRFMEERKRGLGDHEAMKNAVIHSFSSIGASCLTTVAGFVALTFMRYRVGFDMGLVLAKGVLFSLISVIFLMPGITMMAVRWLDKTAHKSFLPSLSGFGRGILKIRFAVIVIAALLIVPAYLAQSKNSFLYGEASALASSETEAGKQEARINERFGMENPVVLLVPKGNIPNEIKLARELESKGFVSSVQALVTLSDPSIPREILPQKVVDNFESENYNRMIVYLNLPEESDATFEAVEEIRGTAEAYYGDGYHLLGSSASLSDIKEVSQSDFRFVNLFSIAAVALIVLITFRSVSIPVLLVLVIETSIWINISIPYFMDEPLSYIGYIVVSAIQLGSTIDYAILLTNRYMQNRLTLGKRESAVKAITDSGWSVITSALILFAAGIGIGVVSTVKAVSELVLLIGRGAALSGFLVLVMLPQILVLFDSLIHKTTLKKRMGQGEQNIVS